MVSRLPLNLQNKTIVLSGKAYLLQVTKKHIIFGAVYRNKQRGVPFRRSHNFDKSILFQTYLIPNSGRELRRSVLPHFQIPDGNYGRSYTPAETYSIPVEFSCRSRPGCMPPGFQSRPRITRLHQADGLDVETFLEVKDHLGMVDDYMLRVNRGIKVGLRA